MPCYAIGDRQPVLHADAWVAEGATLIGSIILERDASIWFGCVLRGDNDYITIGEGSNIQDGCVLHTDPGICLTVGRDVTVGHQAMLHGCTIGEGSLIGIQAVILNHAVIGRHCLIGAGAFIPEGKEIPERSLVVGSPGRVQRELSDEEVERLVDSARRYVGNARRYRQALRRL